MKKIIALLLSVVIITGCNLKEKIEKDITNNPSSNVPILEFDKYKGFSIDNVKSLNVIKYTVAGISEETVSEMDEIQSIFNYISRFSVGNETAMACEDNTTIYEFIMKDDSKVSFEIECDWLVVGNKRYELDKNK